jgi:hypothetical protein
MDTALSAFAGSTQVCAPTLSDICGITRYDVDMHTHWTNTSRVNTASPLRKIHHLRRWQLPMGQIDLI